MLKLGGIQVIPFIDGIKAIPNTAYFINYIFCGLEVARKPLCK